MKADASFLYVFGKPTAASSVWEASFGAKREIKFPLLDIKLTVTWPNWSNQIQIQ